MWNDGGRGVLLALFEGTAVFCAIKLVRRAVVASATIDK
jgi:hypothetical protein